MKSLFFAFVLTCAATAAPVTRDALEAAARKGDSDFPDGKHVQLTSFADVCRLETKKGPIHVANLRSVLTGMPAPRGQNYITFIDDKLKFVSKVHYATSQPLWCAGGKLYLFGAWDGIGGGCKDPRGCNVIDMTSGVAVFVHEKAYGSSGGVDEI